MKYEEIIMDDFDHSIHIAENDWSSFFDDSEECDLLQPSLARPDDSDLSDPEDLGQQESQRSPDTNTSGAESNIADKSYTKSPELPNQNNTKGPEDDAATSMKLVGICVSCPGRNAITTGSVHKESEQDVSTNTAFSSEETKRLTKDGDVQTVSDLKPTEELDLLPYSPAGLSVNEPVAPERKESDVGTEKERWFVTVNDSLERRQGCSTSVKKKRKQKKTCEGGHQGRRRKGSAENNTKQGRYPSDGLSRKFGDLLEKSLGQVKCYELEDVDFFSVHSCDSESCLSAAESVEEAEHPLQENPNLQRLLSPTCDSWTENAEAGRAQDGQMPLHLVAAAANCECYEITAAEPSVTFLSCQRAAEMPDDNSTCGSHTCSGTSGPQTVIDSNACSQEDYLSPLLASDLPPTPCSVADSPETYAKAAGNPKPVYAISAFWDEMEKLTINDILQVRKVRCSPPKLTQEAVIPDPTNQYDLSSSRQMDSSDAADSDYFTQPDESKPDHCSWELLTSDFEEDYWSCAGASANPSPDLHCKNQQRVSSFLTLKDSCTSSEGRETPVPLEDFLGHFDNQDSKKKSQIIHDAEAVNTEDLSLLPFHSCDKNALSLTDLNPNSSLGMLIPACFSSHTDFLDAHYQTSLPEIIECVFRDVKSQSLTVYNPEEIFVAPDFSSTLCSEEASSSCLQTSLDEPIPIFSCSRPTIRELTFPKYHHVFLNKDEISPIRFRSCPFIHTYPHGTGRCWRSLVSMRICFPDKGRISCRTSGIWMFPAETQANQTAPALREGKVGPDSSQVFAELEEPQEVLEAVRTTKRDGIFSTVKQSDMCLVCIAFASWVLRSSDPEAADAWKAALLANVSALSAIQYLRQYTRKKTPPQDGL